MKKKKRPNNWRSRMNALEKNDNPTMDEILLQEVAREERSRARAAKKARLDYFK